jgi:serine/threonine-protein kinase
MALQAGTCLGRYEICSRLGAGGMGEVYLAQDTRLDRKVALKILPAEVAAHPERIRRFVQEAKAASALNHPNILTIYEIDSIESEYFIATEFISGQTLRRHLLDERMKLSDTLEITVQVTSAMVAAHSAGIVHRDIKPENVMIRDDGIVKVLDFGLAKLVQVAASTIDSEAATQLLVETEPGRVLGTVSYMSPEQVRGLEIDARTDIWSLGVLLYELLTGTLPFQGETISHVSVAILEKEPAPLNYLVPELPDELHRIVRKTLAKRLDDRYQTARDLLIDLKNLQRDEAIQSGTKGAPRTSEVTAGDSTGPITRAAVGRPTINVIGELKRHKRGGAIIAAAVLIIAVSGIVYFASHHRSGRNMVYIPGGTFLMGLDDRPPFKGVVTEVPSHAVTVSSFWMDTNEVTNEEYGEFVRETKHEPPVDWTGEQPPQGQEKWPVANVTSEDANSYAAWRSKRDGQVYRLPTEEEWEYAARGGDQDNFYPWGSIWKEGFANVESDTRKPVGSYPQGQSRWGNLDLMGNVWEWTSSRASLYPGNNVNNADESHRMRVPDLHRDWLIIRGGGYSSRVHSEMPLTAAKRDWLEPGLKNPMLGFRLVRTGN